MATRPSSTRSIGLDWSNSIYFIPYLRFSAKLNAGDQMVPSQVETVLYFLFLFIEPPGGNYFPLCIETIAVFAQRMKIPEEGLFVSVKWEHSDGHRDTHIYAYHSSVCTADKLSRIMAILG